jgi:hypothetical protein
MGYYYRCRIPFLGDEDACIAFDALQIGLSSALAAADQGQLVFPSPRHLALLPTCYHGLRNRLKIEPHKSLFLQ